MNEVPDHARIDEPRDWEDHVVDRALRELHGDRPPDLVASIERALRSGSAQPIDLASGHADAGGGSVGARRERLTAGTFAAMALAAAALVIALLSWSSTARGEPGRLAAQRFEIGVTRGELLLASAERSPGPPLHTGATEVVLLSRGDRLHTAARRDTEIQIGPFGIVRTEANTVLEVVDMDVRTKNGWVTAGSLVLAVVAGAASWHWLGMRGHAEAGEVLRLQTPGDQTLTADLKAARAATERLQQENEDLRQRLLSLDANSARLPVAMEPSPAAPDAHPAPAVVATTSGGKPVFDDANFAEVMNSIDWQVMGKVAGEMGIPLVELMQKLEAGEELPLELAVQIQKLNLQLVEQLPKLLKSELPGSGGNGSYTHPLVVANQLASLLENNGAALAPVQRDAMAALVRRFTAEAANIQQNPAELDLDRVIAEVAMKDQMYDELSQQLSPAQRALVYPEGAGTFDGTSLFRSGLIWQSFAAPINAGTPAAYVESASQRLTDQFHFSGDVATQVRAILEQTARTAPTEVWAASSPAERTQNARFLRAGRTMRAAQLQQAWMRRVLHEVPLSAQQREQLRTMQRVFVPLPR